MSRGRSAASERIDQLKRLVEAMERLANHEKDDGDPPSTDHIPHENAMWFIAGAKSFLSGEAKSLESALGLTRGRGRPVESYKQENLERAEDALSLRKQGMT